MPESTLDIVIRQLKETDKPLTEIAKAAEVGERWLYLLADGKIDDPGIKKVEKVFDYFFDNDDQTTNEG